MLESPSPSGGTYTYGDVQRAIWELIEDQQSTTGLGAWTQSHVTEILNAANANGATFVPTCGDMVAVVLQPTSGTAQTITIAQVTFASLGYDCTDTNVVTAVLNGNEFPAEAEIIWTAKHINPEATLTDSQPLPFPEPWPTVITADGTWSYHGQLFLPGAEFTSL